MQYYKLYVLKAGSNENQVFNLGTRSTLWLSIAALKLQCIKDSLKKKSDLMKQDFLRHKSKEPVIYN